MKISKKGVAFALGALLISLAVASFAWACTGQAQIQIVPTLPSTARQAGQSSNRVVAGATITGLETLAHAGLGQVHWNSATGPVIAEFPIPEGQMQARFNMTIPQAAPGVYYLVLVAGPDLARTAVEVDSVASATGVRASSDLWSGFKASGTTAAGGEAASQTSSSGLPFAAGIGLAAFSLTALAGGAAVVALSRRRSGAQKSK